MLELWVYNGGVSEVLCCEGECGGQRDKRSCLPDLKHFQSSFIFGICWSEMYGMTLFKPYFKDNFEGEILLQKEP